MDTLFLGISYVLLSLGLVLLRTSGLCVSTVFLGEVAQTMLEIESCKQDMFLHKTGDLVGLPSQISTSSGKVFAIVMTPYHLEFWPLFSDPFVKHLPWGFFTIVPSRCINLFWGANPRLQPWVYPKA